MAENNSKRVIGALSLVAVILVLILSSGCISFDKLFQIPDTSKQTREALLLECAMKPEGYFRDDCYDGVARLYKDPEICENISGVRGKSNCYREIALMIENISLCDLIKDYDYGQDLCYEEVAEALKNPALCEKIKHILSFRDDCYAALAPGLGDPELCEKINENSTSTWVSCIENVALHNKDPIVCGRLEKRDRDSAYCLIHMAEEMKDHSICERVLYASYRDHCYHKMSVLLNDKSLCKKIKAEHKRKLCES